MNRSARGIPKKVKRDPDAWIRHRREEPARNRDSLKILKPQGLRGPIRYEPVHVAPRDWSRPKKTVYVYPEQVIEIPTVTILRRDEPRRIPRDSLKPNKVTEKRRVPLSPPKQGRRIDELRAKFERKDQRTPIKWIGKIPQDHERGCRIVRQVKSPAKVQVKSPTKERKMASPIRHRNQARDEWFKQFLNN